MSNELMILYFMSSIGRSLPAAFIMAISGIVLLKSLRRIGTNINVSNWMILVNALTIPIGIILLFGLDFGGKIVNYIAFVFLGVSFIAGLISLPFKKKEEKETPHE